jgi:hypothetical protein
MVFIAHARAHTQTQTSTTHKPKYLRTNLREDARKLVLVHLAAVSQNLTNLCSLARRQVPCLALLTPP